VCKCTRSVASAEVFKLERRTQRGNVQVYVGRVDVGRGAYRAAPAGIITVGAGNVGVRNIGAGNVSVRNIGAGKTNVIKGKLPSGVSNSRLIRMR
jgi:hypothetical protein